MGERRTGRERDLRREAAEHAGAQVATRGPHRDNGERIAEQEAERRAGRADHCGLGKDEPREPGTLQAQHAQQRMLAAPARYFQRLCGENEESAGEQGHQRQHV